MIRQKKVLDSNSKFGHKDYNIIPAIYNPTLDFLNKNLVLH
jgi:hypothetical protein